MWIPECFLQVAQETESGEVAVLTFAFPELKWSELYLYVIKIEHVSPYISKT